MLLVQYLLTGKEPRKPSVEVKIFMGVGNGDEGRSALILYNSYIHEENMSRADALQKVLRSNHFLAGYVAELKDPEWVDPQDSSSQSIEKAVGRQGMEGVIVEVMPTAVIVGQIKLD